jgi:glycosyltransferase involved in cell wall biosynthesis
MEVIKKFCKKIEYFHVDTPTYFFNCLKSIGGSLPLQTAGLYDARFHERIKAMVIKHSIDIVYCQLIRMAPYAQNLNRPVVFDYMDALGEGMKLRAKISPWYLKTLYNFEANNVLSYEASISTLFDKYTVISEIDKLQLKSLEHLKLEVLPNGVDHEFFSPQGKVKKYDICFVGNLGYLPNIIAVERIVNEIAPAYFKKYNTNLSILLSGARPTYKILKLQSDYVRVLSWREDIRKSYDESKILCAPIYEGTGQQNKILEAMAMGVPCITSTKVNQSIKAVNGTEILMADKTADIVTAIHLLLNDDEIYSEISTNGRRFVIDRYTWERSIAKLNTIFSAIGKQSLLDRS